MAILAEGGYQPFHLSSTEWVWLVFAAVCALTAIATGFILMRGVLASDQGTPSMIEIAKAVQEGAQAYLVRQFRAIGIIVIPLAVLVFFTASRVTRILPDGTKHTVLSFGLAGLFRALAFLVGGTLSGLAGYIGMSTAVRGNVRTAAAARDGQLAGALKVAFRTGAVTGMFVVGLGLLGATIIVMLFQNTPPPSWSASASAARCWPCSCESGAGSSPRPPTWAPTWSARSRPASPRTTPATPPPSPTTWATTSATAPAWAPTCSSPTS